MIVHPRFVVIHIPKTGGLFLQHVCREHIPGVERGFELDPQAADRDIPAGFEEVPRFAAVRNPWDWHVSWYHYYKQSGRPGPLLAALYNASDRYVLGFRQTIRRLYEKRPVDLLTSQIDSQMRDSLDRGLVSVGRLESLRQDFASFLTGVGVPVEGGLKAALTDGEPVNTTEHGPYRDYYDGETWALVADRAANLIGRYGYGGDSRA